MSLKSKLEAVIYASEEPVTLAQLSTLFGAEALEWDAARKAAEEAATRKAEVDTDIATLDPSQPLVTEIGEYIELRTEDGTLLEQPGFAVLPSAESISPDAEIIEPVGEPELTSNQQPETSTDSPLAESAEEALPQAPAPNEFVEPQTPEPAPFDAEAEAKRVARQRDRDIKVVLRRIIDELIADYDHDDRGIEIREIAGGYRMATKPECHDAVRMFIKSLKPALKLSLPALETLAVIAYKQPVTAPEVNEIRGVDSSGVFGSLLARKLITTAGRKQVIGRPILYKTTKEFLMRFGLKDVNELPSMDEFEKMASELEETEPAPITDPAAAEAYDAEGNAGPELDENAPEEGSPRTGLGPWGREEPDNDSPPSTETSAPTPEPTRESNPQTEPAE